MEKNYFFKLDPLQEKQIKEIPHLSASIYNNLDLDPTIEFFYKRYVQPLTNFFDITQAHMVDCGAGYGWFSFAYLLAGGKYAIMADMDLQRLQAAMEIGHILGIDHRMEIVHSPIQELPFQQDEIDLMVSIETLEHVGKNNVRPALHHIQNITKQGILLTTPNALFPAIAHDTRLPFAHWLPPSLRLAYAKAFGREKMNHNNHFLAPWDLRILLTKFIPATTCLTFPNFTKFRNHYPFYLPYDISIKWQQKPGILKSAHYQLASSILGNYSYWAMPTLARIFMRK